MAAHFAFGYRQGAAQLRLPCGIELAGIALLALNKDTRTKGWVLLQAVPAFEKQDSEPITFLQHNGMNSQNLNLRAKLIHPGLYYVGSRHEDSSRE
jgi:hypothetical protein